MEYSTNGADLIAVDIGRGRHCEKVAEQFIGSVYQVNIHSTSELPSLSGASDFVVARLGFHPVWSNDAESTFLRQFASSKSWCCYKPSELIAG
jgi:hypothetical protein